MTQWDHPTFDLDGSGTFVPLEWDPAPVPTSRPSPRWRIISVGAAAVLLLASGAMGWLAYHNDRTAQQWRHLEQAKAAQVAVLSSEIQQANTTTQQVNVQLTQLHSEITSLKSQLSSSTAQNSTLQQQLSNAGTVAGNLQQCIDATKKLNSDANSFTSLFDFGSIDKESKNANQTCQAAESANQGLQSNLQNG
ncbi:MAG TPA: hypothetical protein VG435_00160 [Acidimicrobiales bacterium]|jgi:chromosome segregation ATPase|nr:hypothetical protein [Acidimicrobiales bacterium]